MSSNTVYGKYSLGSGNILKDRDTLWSVIDDPAVIADYRDMIKRDLRKAGIPLHWLSNSDVMDVGTGRQAIAFHELGARKVRHYDLSPENVARMGGFLDRMCLGDALVTESCDLVEHPLDEEVFDLIYLSGIVQHFSNVGKGLLNCCRAVRPGGYLWLYFYRSGAFAWFVMNMVRDLVSLYPTVQDYFIASALLHSIDARPSYKTSSMMDGLFVEYMHLYRPECYLDFCSQAGFEPVSSSGLDPHGKHVDHEFAIAATVVTLKKTRPTVTSEVDISTLSPARSVNQLNPDLYDDQIVRENISLYGDIREHLEGRQAADPIIMSVAFRLFDFVEAVEEDWSAFDRHEKLRSLLTNIGTLLIKA